MLDLGSQDIQAAFTDQLKLLEVHEVGFDKETDVDMPDIQKRKPAQVKHSAQIFDSPQGLKPLNHFLHSIILTVFRNGFKPGILVPLRRRPSG